MTNIIVCGAAGKMGKRILELANNDNELRIIAGIERKDHPEIGKKISEKTLSIIDDNLEKFIDKTDVIIDFTNPLAALEHSETVGKYSKSMVIGTTGFKYEEIEKLKKNLSKSSVVFSPNMSLGVNLLFELVKKVVNVLPNYDVEIVEIHHNQKKDAPSGTAMKLAEIISKELGRDITKVGVFGREGIVGARKEEEIGIFSVRLGDVVGEHNVMFAGNGERLELIHRAYSRDTFAKGAIAAAKWVVKQKVGFYSMKDLLVS